MKAKAESIVHELKTRLSEHNFATSLVEEKQFNFEFRVSDTSGKVKVQVYFGKKGIRKVIQGNDSSDLYKKVSNLINEQQSIFFTTKITEPESYIGSDETGKGSVFGPLVICAFYCDPQIKLSLIELDVRDSKELSDYKINSIGRKLEKSNPGIFEVVLITPEKYNELQQKFNNINKLLNWAHGKAISNLLSKVKCEKVIVDKFSKEILSSTDLDKYPKLQIEYLEKAEKFTGVAAASIMARYKMNDWFEKTSRAGIQLPKGASEGIEEAVKFLTSRVGKDGLSKYVKMHFKNVQKLI